MSIEDTSTVLDELHDKINRLWTLETDITNRARSRAETLSTARENCKWIRKLINYANSGKNVEWLGTELEWLETDGLEGVPQHIVDHAISLAKQAIAKEAPSLV